MTGCGKKAPRRGAFFASQASIALVLLFVGVAAPASDCRPRRIDEQAIATWVFDGDTIEIDHSAHVRFIGINAPEIGKDGKADEPYAQAARKRLQQLLHEHGNRVALRLGREKHDRYQRLLAHLYFDDGTSIQEQLLREGLATTLEIPPNVSDADCYVAAEREARNAGRGVWSLPAYQPQNTTDLKPSAGGYHIVRGIVVRIGHSRKSIWLNLTGNVALRIARSDLRYFPGYDWDNLGGKTVIVRGWIRSQRGDLQMRVRHPAALEILE